MRRWQVQRGECASGWWEFVRSTPDARLTGVVSGQCGYREHAVGAFRRRVPANTNVALILSFGDRIDVLDPPNAAGSRRSYESFVGGVKAGYTDLEHEGGQHGIQVDLTPLGAHRVFGIPAPLLAGQVLTLGDVAPDLARSLPDQLASLPTWRQRFGLVDNALAAMVDRGREPDRMVSWMWNQLQASGGQLRISELVKESGWSHRHVASLFRRQVGLTPKAAAAAVIRFERAAAATRSAALSEVAAQCGYADQSHLTREFVRLAGYTPAHLGDRTANVASGGT